MTKIATQFLLSVGIVAAATVPEVIPGPGLPSLESLNLTSQDLYAMGPIESKCADVVFSFHILLSCSCTSR